MHKYFPRSFLIRHSPENFNLFQNFFNSIKKHLHNCRISWLKFIWINLKVGNWVPHKHRNFNSFLLWLCAIAWLRRKPLSSLMSPLQSDNYVRSKKFKNTQMHESASWMCSSVCSSAPLKAFQLETRTLIHHHEATLFTL